MKIKPTGHVRNHKVDATYKIANGFAKMLEEAIKAAELEKEERIRKVECKFNADGFDKLV